MIKDLISEEVQKYIDHHLYDDTNELLLREKSFEPELLKLIVEQIKSKKKAKSKIPSWFNTAGLMYPKSISMEQCSSEETAGYKASLVQGEKMVDLTGGFGVDTYFLSSSFKHTQYVERDRLLTEQAAHNFNALSAKIDVNNTDAEVFLSSMDSADLIYLDPARRDLNSQRVFQLEDCTPNVIELQDQLLEKSHQVMVKLSPMLDIKLALSKLKAVSSVHVVAVKNEVKELLFTLQRGFKGLPIIYCVNLGQIKEGEFKFDYNQEDEAVSNFSEVENFIYEPNASIMKAGAFKLIGLTFGLKKLNQHTHLYTSKELVEGFPGRCFKVVKDIAFNKRIKQDVPEMKANITVRNYPMTVAQIRKKTGIKEGGISYIYAFSDMAVKRAVLCQKEY